MLHSLSRCLHYIGHRSCRQKHDPGQHCSYYNKQSCKIPHSSACFFLFYGSDKLADNNRPPCTYSQDNPGYGLHHLSSDGCRRHTCRICEPADDQQIHSTIKCLKHAGSKERHREFHKCRKDLSLNKFSLVSHDHLPLIVIF